MTQKNVKQVSLSFGHTGIIHGAKVQVEVQAVLKKSPKKALDAIKLYIEQHKACAKSRHVFCESEYFAKYAFKVPERVENALKVLREIEENEHVIAVEMIRYALGSTSIGGQDELPGGRDFYNHTCCPGA